MKYVSFEVNKYKAILAFDYYNDSFDELYHHLQDTNNLYDAGDDLSGVKESLGLAKNTSFEKTIYYLYYSDSKDEIIKELSKNTKDSFAEVGKLLKF